MCVYVCVCVCVALSRSLSLSPSPISKSVCVFPGRICIGGVRKRTQLRGCWTSARVNVEVMSVKEPAPSTLFEYHTH